MRRQECVVRLVKISGSVADDTVAVVVLAVVVWTVLRWRLLCKCYLVTEVLIMWEVSMGGSHICINNTLRSENMQLIQNSSQLPQTLCCQNYFLHMLRYVYG
jgi:hypothetical protein